MNVIWSLLFWYLRTSAAQSSNCNFYQQVTATARYTISSPNYPANYTGALQCRWIADCPEGYNCRLDCPDIWLPQSPNCQADKLLVSKSGDPQLAAAEVYCGRGTLSVVSTRQRISIGLITSSNTKGGRFTCEISAQPVTSAPNCNCGVRRQNRIVGGHDTEINEYPMMVGLVDVRIRQIKCGAVIISSYHVLTAAHCLTYLELSSTAVIVGEHDTSQGESPATAAYSVSKFEIHPLFSNNTNDYDIGIVTVAGPIVFSDRVGPVCLPFKYTTKDFAFDKVTVLGWGTLFPGGPDSKVLQEVDLDVITEMQCRYKEPSVTYRQICTFTRGKDACQDDSGGPLLYTDPSTALLFVVGIVSNGRSCASPDYPGINTRVTQFLDWIVTNTRVSYCVKN